MPYTDVTVNNLIVNVLTQEEYDSIQNPSSSELYLITDDALTPAQAVENIATVSAVGTSTQYARADHVHAITGTAITSALGYTPGQGTLTDSKVNGTSIVSDGVANLVTNTAYNASSNKIATMSDVPEDKLFLVTATMSGLTAGTSDKSVTEIAAAVAAGKFVYIKTTVGTTTITAPLMHVVDTVDVSKAVFNYDDQQNSSQLYHAVLEITGTTVTITWTNEKYARESQIPDSTSDLTNDSGFITAATAPVTSVNSKTGDVVLTIPAAVAVKGNAESSYRTGNVNLTPANIGAATSDHTHKTSLATSTGTSTITLAHGSKYQLTAGGTSVIFTMPADSNTDTKVTNTLATTSKYYITGTASASTNTGTQLFDSEIYSTPMAGQLNATTYLVNEKVRLEYNSTTKSLDFIFVTPHALVI